MDIVDNIEQAESSEEKTESTVGIGLDQNGLNDICHSFYVQNMNTLENLYKQVGQGLEIEMASQIENFDPNGEHKELFTASVHKNMPPGAEPYIMGIINGGLVTMLEVGRRMNLDTQAISDTLNSLNPTDNKTKEDLANLKKSQNEQN